jgi:hypothetical protein
MRAFSRAQHVVSTIICWCCRSSGISGDFGAKQGQFVAVQALQPAHEPYSHTGTLPRSSAVAVAERGFPRLIEAWYRNAGATSLSPVAAGNQVLALLVVAFVSYGTNLPDTWPQACVYVGRIFKGEKRSELPAVQPARFELAANLKAAKNPASRSRQRGSAAPTR